MVAANVTWSGVIPFEGKLELVRNGVVVEFHPGNRFTANVDFRHSGSLAARVVGANGHRVHTAADFVTAASAPVRASRKDTEFFVQWINNLLARTTPPGDWSQYLSQSREQAHARYAKAREIYRAIAAQSVE